MTSIEVQIIKNNGDTEIIQCQVILGQLTIENTDMAAIDKVDPDAKYTGSPVTVKILLNPTQTIDINDNAFTDFGSHVTGDLIIPQGVINIGTLAFSNTGFTGTLILPPGLLTIGNGAFANVLNIESQTIGIGPLFTGDLIIPDSVVSIGNVAFVFSGFTGNLKINGSLDIGPGAFNNTGFRGTLTLNSGVKTIGDSAFANLIQGEEIPTINIGPIFTGDLIIPDSVVSIGYLSFVFSGFTGNLTINGSLDIGRGAFNNTGFRGTLTLNNGVKTIGDGAFANLLLGEGEEIPTMNIGPIFTGDLIIPDSVISIGNLAFVYSGFTGNLTINGSLDIGYAAFSNTGFRGTLTLNNGVKTIGDGAFVNVLLGEEILTIGIGPIFTGDLIMPDSVISIGNLAFVYSGFTGSLFIGNSITNIGSGTFTECNFTGTITIPENVKTIGDKVITSNVLSKIFISPSLESVYTTSFGRLTGDIITSVIPCEMNLSTGNVLSLTFQNESTVIQTGSLPPGITFSGNVLSGTAMFPGVYTAYFTASPSFTLTFVIDGEPLCFLPVSRILMKDGDYKEIRQITAGDMVISAFSTTPVKVKHCGYTAVKFCNIEKTNLPYAIPPSYFSHNVPSSTVYISGHHRIINHTQAGFLGVQAFKIVKDTNAISSEERILEISGCDSIRYYHIELEGGTNAVYSEGLAVETMSEGQWEKSFSIEN